MGKHGGVVGRQRLSMRAITLGVLLLAGLATASWWWSLQTPSDPIDQNPVAAPAFVVSSPSCTDSDTGTVVDLFPVSGGQARAVINGCGYTDGQQLAVEYLAGDPSQARLAGADAAPGTDEVRQWWPIGLGVLAVLAAGLAAVLVVDGRSRRDPRAPARSGDRSASAWQFPHARHAQDETADAMGPDAPGTVSVDPIIQLTAMVSSTADRGVPSLTALAGVAAHPGGRHALMDVDEQPLGGAESDSTQLSTQLSTQVSRQVSTLGPPASTWFSPRRPSWRRVCTMSCSPIATPRSRAGNPPRRDARLV